MVSSGVQSQRMSRLEYMKFNTFEGACESRLPFVSTNEYYKKIFGEKVYKLSLDGGFTCPNRDGRLDTRGCIFCSAGGSGEFASSRALSITDQIDEAKKKVSKKAGTKYIAYFQAFTNTYGPVDHLREIYQEALDCSDIVGLSIATRPDCIDSEIVNLLTEMSKQKPIWVELGLQTMHERTAEYIRRGYSLKVYEESLRMLHAARIPVIVHIILGLPGESREDMLSTVDYVVGSRVSGVKLQLLHVLEGTDLAKDYEEGKFSCMTEDEYVSLIRDCLQRIPRTMVVHRLTGDGDKKLLLAPAWSGNKRKVMNHLQKICTPVPYEGEDVELFHERYKEEDHE